MWKWFNAIKVGGSISVDLVFSHSCIHCTCTTGKMATMFPLASVSVLYTEGQVLRTCWAPCSVSFFCSQICTSSVDRLGGLANGVNYDCRFNRAVAEFCYITVCEEEHRQVSLYKNQMYRVYSQKTENRMCLHNINTVLKQWLLCISISVKL